MTPAAVHHGHADTATRRPRRLVPRRRLCRGTRNGSSASRQRRPELPTAAWINKPKEVATTHAIRLRSVSPGLTGSAPNAYVRATRRHQAAATGCTRSSDARSSPRAKPSGLRSNAGATRQRSRLTPSGPPTRPIGRTDQPPLTDEGQATVTITPRPARSAPRTSLSPRPATTPRYPPPPSRHHQQRQHPGISGAQHPEAGQPIAGALVDQPLAVMSSRHRPADARRGRDHLGAVETLLARRWQAPCRRAPALGRRCGTRQIEAVGR